MSSVGGFCEALRTRRPHAPVCLVQVLKCEVELMARMAKAIDSFTQNQTRLVVIIDGLDACEQDKVLQMLDTVRRRPRARTAGGWLRAQLTGRLKCTFLL